MAGRVEKKTCAMKILAAYDDSDVLQCKDAKVDTNLEFWERWRPAGD